MLFHSIPVHLTCFCYLNFSDTGLNIAFFALYGLLWIVCFCRCLFDVKSTWYTGNPMSSFAFRHCYQCKFHGCLWYNKNDFSEEAKHRTSLGKSTDVLHRKYGCLPQRSPMFLFSVTMTDFTSQIICYFTTSLHIFCNVFLRCFTGFVCCS